MAYSENRERSEKELHGILSEPPESSTSVSETESLLMEMDQSVREVTATIKTSTEMVETRLHQLILLGQSIQGIMGGILFLLVIGATIMAFSFFQ